jgi:hypothetical protein
VVPVSRHPNIFTFTPPLLKRRAGEIWEPSNGMKTEVFWDVASCGRVDISWDFGGIYYTHLHGGSVNQEKYDDKASRESSSENSGNIHQTTRRHYADKSHNNEIKQREDYFSPAEMEFLSHFPWLFIFMYVSTIHFHLSPSFGLKRATSAWAHTADKASHLRRYKSTGKTTNPDSQSFRPVTPDVSLCVCPFSLSDMQWMHGQAGTVTFNDFPPK